MAKIVGSITKASYVTPTKNNPYTTKLLMVLTDFKPNANNEGVPKSEIENITRSALHMPIKINFARDKYGNHAEAIPIGPITSVFLDEADDVLYAEALIWDEYFKDISEHIADKIKTGEPVKASWEIAHDGYDEIDGVKWLKDCTLVGHCIVENPAYKERVRVLSVASKEENKQMDEINKLIELINAMYTHVTGKTVENEVISEELSFASVKDTITNRVSEITNTYDQVLTVPERLKKLSKFMDLDNIPVKTIASMNDDSFELFVSVAGIKGAITNNGQKEDSKDVIRDTDKDTKKDLSSASAKGIPIPDVSSSATKDDDTDDVSILGIAKALLS